MGTREELVLLAFKKSVEHNIQLDTAEDIINRTINSIGKYEEIRQQLILTELAGRLNNKDNKMGIEIVTDIIGEAVDIIKEGLG